MKLADTLYKLYSKDNGKQLVHTGALGWLFSSLAQVWVVATDKNISKREKKFLVPQEICDGATNVTLYYTISQLIKKGGDLLVDKGYLTTDDVVKAIETLSGDKSSLQNGINAIKDSCTFSTNAAKKEFTAKPINYILENFSKLDVYKNLPADKQIAVKEAIESAVPKFAGFKNGIGVIAAIGASILACNLITPVVRNKMAGMYQQKYILSQDEKSKSSYNPQPVPKTFQVFNMSSGMRI